MHSAVDIARGLLTNAETQGISLSDADLHRLAVHAQAWFMAVRDRPLFGDPIIAGENGPIIPAIREAQINGGIARFADDDEGYEALGEYAYWQTGSAVADLVAPSLSEDEINAEIDTVVAASPRGCEVDRDALSRRVCEEVEKRRGPPPDPDTAIRRLDKDLEFRAMLLEKAMRPSDLGFRPR